MKPLFAVILLLTGVSSQTIDNRILTVANEISNFLPCFTPDSNSVIVEAKSFKIRSLDLLDKLQHQMGSDFDQIPIMSPDQIESMIGKNIEYQIEKHLIVHAAKQKGLEISQSKVDSIFENLIKINDGMADFSEILAATGIDIEFLRRDIHYNLLRESYLDSYVYKRNPVTEKQILEAYQRDKTVSVRHILIKTDPKDEENNKFFYTKLNGIRQRALNGEDFSQLAVEFSQDPGSKQQGGLIPNFQRGQMVAEFETAAFEVPVGEISEIIETQFGIHIIYVLERQSEQRPLNQIRPELIKQLQNEQRQTEYHLHLQHLRTSQQVVIKLCALELN